MTHVHLFAEGDTAIEASGVQAWSMPCGWNITAAARSRERPTEQAVAVAMATRRGQCRVTAVVALCRLAAQLQRDCQRPSCCWMRRPGLVHGGVPGVCPRPGESWLQRVRAVLHRSSSLFYQHLAHRSCMIYNRTARTATAHYFTIRASTPNTGGPSSRANDGRFFFDKAAPLRHFEGLTSRSYYLTTAAVGTSTTALASAAWTRSHQSRRPLVAQDTRQG